MTVGPAERTGAARLLPALTLHVVVGDSPARVDRLLAGAADAVPRTP